MWIPETMMTSNYIKARDEIGTIDNGRLYVAVSSICEQPILGLFAGVQFKAGDVITSYGGLLKTAHEVRKSGTMKSHVRRIPGSIYVRDGYEWSQCFDRKSTEYALNQKNLVTSERAHLKLCSRAKAPKSLLDILQASVADKKSPLKDKAVASVNSASWQDMCTRISTEGLGYMSNTAHKSLHNVKVIPVNMVRDGLYPAGLFYIAKKDIEINEEIIAPYNNHDPALIGI